MKTYDLLGSLDFGRIVAENLANNNTQTGRDLLEKYSAICMKSAVSCGLVNRFLSEAKTCMYDSAVYEAAKAVDEVIRENRISWALATACESINANSSKYNALNRKAADHVMEALSGRSEEEMVRFIRQGGLKPDMFCESIRNIVKSVYKDQAVVVETAGYTCEHPISYVEIVEGKTYFALGNRIFNIDAEDNLTECRAGEKTGLSMNFSLINETLSKMTYNGNGCFSYTLPGNNPIEYQIDEAGSITRLCGANEDVLTVESFRENNRLYLMTINPAHKNQVARLLEGLARVAENFDNVVLVEEVSYITTSRGKKFMIIEGKDCVNFNLLYASDQTPFTKNYTSIIECLNDVKAYAHVDLTSLFEERINEEFEAKTAAEQAAVTEALNNASIQDRRNRIAALTEAYKNDPATLAVLSRIAIELNELS